MVTVAPGTTPDLSRTVPTSVPVVTCAAAEDTSARIIEPRAIMKMRSFAMSRPPPRQDGGRRENASGAAPGSSVDCGDCHQRTRKSNKNGKTKNKKRKTKSAFQNVRSVIVTCQIARRFVANAATPAVAAVQ